MKTPLEVDLSICASLSQLLYMTCHSRAQMKNDAVRIVTTLFSTYTSVLLRVIHIVSNNRLTIYS